MPSSTDPKNISPVIYTRHSISALPAESFPTPVHGEVSWVTLLSTPQTPSSDMAAGLATLPPRTGHLCKHRHTQSEIYYITTGKGIVFIDGKEYPVEKGSVVFIPGDAEHGIWNTEKNVLEWFYVFPTAGFGDVVYRFSSEEKEKEKEEGHLEAGGNEDEERVQAKVKAKL
ncbi:RmlC-like cupin domain-containing protein [Aspergillus karnatakaensis]|uniref:RmlC-like cupin domain-containing protein n=1 Tax=Aspergillus karnatakaensis TaxID=1810916 RepID=UPI003CCD2A89